MKGNTLFAIALVVLLLAGLTVAASAADGEGITVVSGRKIYVVRPGDTLAGIAQRFLGDAGRWRELLQANPQIVKADRIYPGDAVVIGEAPEPVALGVREKAAPAAAAAPVAIVPATIAPQELMEGSREEAESVLALATAATALPPAIPAAVFETCGFITADLPQAAILDSPDGRQLLSPYDVAFINRGDRDGLTVGQEFRILHPVREIRHPATGASLGWLVKVVGRLRAECLQSGTASARIVVAYDVINPGDRLEPYSPVTVPAERYLAPKLTGPCLPSSEGVGAVIVAVRNDHDTIGEGDTIYLDRGLASGITPGTRMAVYREGSGGGSFLVGEAQVLLSQSFTATALVTNSVHPIRQDDRLTTW